MSGSLAFEDNLRSGQQQQHHHLAGPINDTNETTRSAVLNFYQNRSILITGGSGFIGKVLVEKLLRTCPGVRRIFVLIRPKWNKQPQERLEQMLNSPLFHKVRKSGVEIEKKVLLVEGDVIKPNLGLSEQNLLRIMNEVSVIYHSAATVKFDEPLKQSVAINIAGLKTMIEICRKIPQLAALVHVSTAYANCDKQDEIDEHIYPVGNLEPEQLIEMANWLDQETLQELKMKLLQARPNTYTYTKALAEWLLVKSGRDLPVVICRPSIVVAAQQEPLRGWIDNCNGPTGIILGTGKGLIRTMLGTDEYVADLVPVDSVVNLIIVLGWFAHIYQNHKRSSNNELLEDSQTESLVGSCDSASADADSLDGSLNNDHDDAGILSVANGKLASAMYKGELNHDKSCRETTKHDRATRVDDDECANNNNNNSSPEFVHQHHHNHHHHHHHQNGQITISNENCTSESASLSERTPKRDLSRLHLDDGYGTQSPDYRSQSASSSSNCSLKHAILSRPAAKLTPEAAANDLNKVTESKQEATANLGNRNDECDYNYNLESCKLIENEKFQSFVAQRRLAEEKHAAFEYKLKQFRHNVQLKLAAKNLPEELADVPVFHCTSGAENPITWGRISMLTLTALVLFPSLSIHRYPSAFFTSNKRLEAFLHLTLHLIPAYLADLLAVLCGAKPTMVKIFRKYEQATQVLNAFTMTEWKFNSNNRLLLYNELLSSEDRRLFNCDMVSIDWPEFFRTYVLGVRRFILKEPDETIDRAKVKLRNTYYRNLSLQILTIALIAYIVFV